MSQNKKTSRYVVKRKRRSRKRLLFVLLPTLIVFLGVLTYGAYLYIKADTVLSDSYVENDREKSPLRDAVVDPGIDNVSILIMGTDSNDHRENADNARTDALMLATFNRDDSSVKLLSIPRDSLVYIPHVGYEDKINHANAFGGPSAAVETVENLLDVPVDYYVQVNFHAFVDIVDALGGITAEVPYEFKESDSMDKRDSIHLLEGIQELDGEEALALARTRKLDNDIQRGKRQQDIMKAIINEATSLSSIFNYDNVLEAVGDNMTTDMSFNEMKTFITYGTNSSGLDVESFTLEGTDYQPSGVYYWLVDDANLADTQARLKAHLEVETPFNSETQDAASESTPY